MASESKRGLTGYGRGWSEPKATAPIARFLQIMREPATKTTWTIATAAFTAISVLIILAKGGA